MVRWKMMRRWVGMLGAGLVALAVGCGGSDDSGGGSQTLSTRGNLVVEYNSTTMNLDVLESIRFSKAGVLEGGTTTESLTLSNTGLGPLTVDLTFEYDRPAAGVAETEETPALSLDAVTVNGEAREIITSMSGVSLTQRVEGLVIEPKSSGGGDIVVTLRYRRYEDEYERGGRLRVQSDTRDAPYRDLTFQVVEGGALPVAEVDPLVVDFGIVNSGETKQQAIQIANTGSDALFVTSLVFQGHPDYRLRSEGAEFPPDNEPIVFDPPLEIGPSQVETIEVTYTPENATAAEGTVRVYTNDPQYPSGIAVALQANTKGPAIDVDPDKVQFGGKLVGKKALLPVEINSVGTADLVITGVHFTEDSDVDFTIDFSTVPGYEDLPDGPTEENPLTIPINSKATFNVVYIPSVTSPLGENGQPVFDQGFLVVESNAFTSELEVEVTGLGVDTECPTAVATIQEGEQVIPQTLLHLFGDQSFAPAGAIASWEWSVQQPSGSASVFIPSAQFPNPTFEANTAGEYIFKLDVYDENGEKSCVPWETTVLVIPDEAIHVELLWHTPNDPDETDEGPEAGSDVDLHFVHDKYAVSGPDLDGDGAPDPWFDQPFDCFWFNAHPNWGSFDPSIDDDPGLDRDDTDGAGPENLNLNIPENTTYRIGVHYWSDHEYGDSLVTVRIYIYSNLVFEVEDVQLSNHDMWNVATIGWPSGTVTLVQDDGGGYKITPNYQNPFFGQ